MSATEQPQDVASATLRIRELTATINSLTTKRRKRQRITAVVGVVLAVSVSFSLGGLTNMTKQLDAEALAQIGRQQLERRLPAARLNVQDYLETEAPRIVTSTMRSMLEALPHVRTFVFKGLSTSLDELNFDFERKTVEIMSHAVLTSKNEVDKAYPDLGDREKLEKLVELVAKKFRESIRESTLALYPDYKAELDRVASHLDTLQHQDPETLTNEQRIHKEIIQTLLQLLERQQQTLSANK